MTGFLEKLTDDLLAKHNGDLSKLCLVFPTRRAGLYFKKIYSSKLSSPAWSPVVYAIEDFIQSLSHVQIPDQLDLVFELFEVYRKYFPSESFDKFYPWGVMLLSDFNDADASLAKTEQLFSYISDLRTIDEQFELEGENLERIQEFWKIFFGKEPGDIRKNFIDNWKHLGDIHKEFKAALLTKNLAYAGLASRIVAESQVPPPPKGGITSPSNPLEAGGLESPSFGGVGEASHYVFAGFNALTKAEQSIIKHFLKTGIGSVYYDADEYYVDDLKQEAGVFIRENVFKIKDLKWKETLLVNDDKKIDVIGVPLQSLQAKITGQILHSNPELGSNVKTAIVLPDENLLMPVLYSLPSNISDINVTMGYPLHASPLFGLIESLFDLQKNIREKPKSFYFKNVLGVLSHPLLQNLYPQDINKWMITYRENLWIRISQEELLTNNSALFKSLFSSLKQDSLESVFEYFNSFFSLLIDAIRKNKNSVHSIEKEYIYYFYTRFKKLEEIIRKYGSAHSSEKEISINTFRSLFREVIHSTRIPFTGEPLKGLQIMGFLETRTLDFENLIILSLNEGVLPASSNHPSFIPFNIRKAFGLPTYEEQNAIASYHFYRLLQRAKNIHLIYNTEVKSLQGGEKSRFLLQIENELLRKNPNIKYSNHSVDLSLKEIKSIPVSIRKTDEVMEELQAYFEPSRQPLKYSKKFSASALIQYITCPLRFYFQYIARLREIEEAEEHIEGGLLGTILHEAMHTLYSPFKQILKEDFVKLESQIEKAVDQAIGIHFSSADTLEGKNVLMRNIILELVRQIVSFDKNNAPLQIKYLEAEFGIPFRISNGKPVTLYGIIDRVDVHENSLRVVDYKTGKRDVKESKNIEQLFASPDYKEQFQAFFYSWLLHKKENNAPVKAGLFRLREISKGISYINGGETISDGEFVAFEENLKKLLEDIFNPDLQFLQTEDEKRCTYCSFKDICNR